MNAGGYSATVRRGEMRSGITLRIGDFVACFEITATVINQAHTMRKPIFLLALSAAFLTFLPSVAHADSKAPAVVIEKRAPLPLLAHMAEHQRQQMRDHLAAIQEILAHLATNDFAGVEKAAGRIGYSQQMEMMCQHMGSAAPGFTDLALRFHRTADTIADAAKKHDAKQVLTAVAATMSTCVACHAAYRQEIVDDATWEKLTGGK